ncbi:hypothetical protein TNCV_1054391 [Trichonephila clavipes]|uniref:Uncharacterized protein n=1 Tax=Trichonephila inaurata madagascariensis TaxID=2747483 RepID=A0A8X6XK01_9ARAC|nr:hypothetical protein TNCV_1054391 [Trichonephila clavipes]GFY53096.1 hypothetical protein TNIN_362261 [Trichonephila inaurata madagascariensis]
MQGSPGVILSRLSGANGVKRKNVYESRDPILTLSASLLILQPSPPHPKSMIQEEIGKIFLDRACLISPTNTEPQGIVIGIFLGDEVSG